METKKIVIIGLTLGLIVIGLEIVNKLFTENTETNNTNILSVDKIIPGSTTLTNVKTTYGDPIKISQKNNYTEAEYPSVSKTRNNLLVADKSDVVQIYKEMVAFNSNIKEIVDKYGETENILYGPESKIGFYLYIYPTKGIAYLGNKNGNTALIEIWHFNPTNNLEEFKLKYASEYSDKPQTEKYP